MSPIPQRALNGSVSVFVKIDADTRDLAAAKMVRTIGVGCGLKPIDSPGTYDQKHIVRVGHLEDCIAYGPGILDLAHQPDEYVGIDDMVASAKVMAAATLALLGETASR